MLATLPAVLCGHGPIWGLRYVPIDVIPGCEIWLYSQSALPGFGAV